ncbi:Coniferyl aldehyde dehydrogenase [Zhongshania aliphaticivorans]|uniref:Aldehyde dehydrogenase n=1 Tax=Zhongshania aliphaticivorans TaxID=1470434 RepID=A0A5S9QIJ9_9GAMM|nr:coniferyl aldehyde dehydrogenase [Zhongshania aliphaticivorans]CAA0111368.1 Coniferyl aldehyde dehydrogenase [Zhongshania aliphaticivorans]CAA0118595.1 Coniferyl aldehyde dehydrogenase [Zhongshania aliphaticivorans]
MTSAQQYVDIAPDDTAFSAVFNAQKSAFNASKYPDYASRHNKLKALENLLLDNRDAIIAALHEDFGHRSADETRIAEISSTVAHIRYARKNLAKWMRPQRRATSIWFLPGSNHIQAQPAGVIGIMAPWNYPINLAVAPLTSALAAGNRAMIKMSEYTPASTKVLKTILAKEFDESEIAVFGGEAESSAQFSKLPFDHLMFTGSIAVGKKVMAAAAPNLTPLTLELGGKSPVIINKDYPMEEAASRITFGKIVNAGQTCVAPDYILLPKGKAEDFAMWMSRKYADRLPEGACSQDYTSIIDQRNYNRLIAILDDAISKGATVIPLEQNSTSSQEKRKFPLTLVINPSSDCRIMQEEIFGPLLPVIETDGLDDAIARINAGGRPLALYYFGHAPAEQEKLLRQTHSGGVTVNDVLLQFLQPSQPFGGTGSSGFGSCHGWEGFRSFSHMKPVFTQKGIGGFTGLKLLYPPYGPLARRLITMMGG